MVKTEKNLTNIKLTESDEDGIWLHFDGGNLKASISLQALSVRQSTGITAATIQNWAREQLAKQEAAHRRFYLHPELDRDTLEVIDRVNKVLQSSTRPSPPVDGGY